jgi:hypothetical protein
MAQKCSKCIQHFREDKQRLELIHDLKNQNEGISHAILKSEVCKMIRELGHNTYPDSSVTVETEVCVEGIGKVDVVGRIDEVTIVVECGNTSIKKILALKEKFDIVLHIPYCYTRELFIIDFGELEHQFAVALISKELEKRNLTKGMEKNKPICLEKGECSLPSGRNGYPEEAIQIALEDANDVLNMLKQREVRARAVLIPK